MLVVTCSLIEGLCMQNEETGELLKKFLNYFAQKHVAGDHKTKNIWFYPENYPIFIQVNSCLSGYLKSYMTASSQPLDKVDAALFERVTKLVDQIGDKEEHFNQLQTDYRKLASTWLLAAFGACGYSLKSTADLPFDEWYFVFGICLAASAGLGILWLMDLKVYQTLLGAFFIQGVLLELKYDSWLLPIRINIVLSQKTGEIVSKVQYYYFFSIVSLQFLEIIALWNFKSLKMHPTEKILYTLIILAALGAAQFVLLRRSISRKKHFNESELGRLINQWQLKMGNHPGLQSV